MCNSVFFVPMRDKSNAIVELADSYCNLGGRVAEVVTERNSQVGKIRYYKMHDESQSCLSTLLKVASYILFLGIPWLIACAIKAHHRYSVKYQEIPLSRLVPGQIRSTQTGEDVPVISNPIVETLVEDLSTEFAQQGEGTTPPEVESPVFSPIKIEETTPATTHPMEKVQEELLAWWNEKDGADKFKHNAKTPINPDLVSKLKQLATQETACPKKEIILVWMGFRYGGFGFYYAHMHDGKKHLPIPRRVGFLLDTAKEQNIELPWLFKDPATKSDVIIQVKKLGESNIPKAGGSMTVESYLGNLVYGAKSDRTSEEFLILEALIPYAFNVKQTLGDTTYQQLRALIPTYPENPGIHLT